MDIKLWGVRGSIPSPGQDTIKYGGNTTCLSIDFGENIKETIIDGGTGLRLVGNYLIKKYLPQKNIDVNIFITHSHWDHIMGFPFFAPIYIPSTKLEIYGPVTHEDGGLDEIINNQFQYRYFPVVKSELSAKIKYIPLKETVFNLASNEVYSRKAYVDSEACPGGDVVVTTKFLNHPVLCLSYKFEQNGKTFCFATDSEPYRNIFEDDPYQAEMKFLVEEGQEVAGEENRKNSDFFKNADLLIHDAQYTDEEWKKDKLGWGHASIEYVIETAYNAGVKKLVLTHHDPERTDEQIDNLASFYYKKYEKINREMPFSFAKEGSVISL